MNGIIFGIVLLLPCIITNYEKQLLHLLYIIENWDIWSKKEDWVLNILLLGNKIINKFNLEHKASK